MFNHFFRRAAMVLSISVLGLSVAHADIVISGTRVVYKQNDHDITLKLDNRGNRPVLTQLWIDDGQDETQPQNMKVPFIVTPPISRIDASRGQTVRISYIEQGHALAKDRETLYWFNVLEIPAKAKDGSGANVLQLAFRTRIKMFYRPDGLEGSVTEAAKLLKWQLQNENGKVIAKVTNNSAYYISFSNAEFTSGNSHFTLETKMIAPKSTEKFEVKGLQAIKSGDVDYSTINDLGGAEKNKVKV